MTEVNSENFCQTCGGGGAIEASYPQCCGKTVFSCCGNPVEARVQEECPDCNGSGLSHIEEI